MGIVVHTHTSSAKEVEMKGTSGLTGQPVQTNWSVKDPVSKTKVEMYVVGFFFLISFGEQMEARKIERDLGEWVDTLR